MMQEKTEQSWTQTDSAPGASQDQAAFGGDKGTDAAHEAAGPRGYGAHGGPHPQGRGNGGAQNAGPGMEPSTGHGTPRQNAAAYPRGREPGRVQIAGPGMEPSTGRTMYSRAELQRELDRVAKKERERGRRQAQREQQAAEHVQGETEGAAETLFQEGQAPQDSGDARLGRPQPDGTEPGGPAAEEQSAEADPADLLDAEQQRMLGHAMADKAISEGDEAVQRGIEQLLLKEEPLTAREDETLFWLFNHASLKACAEELTKRGVDGEGIVKDKDFIAFAEMMRSDVPLKVYEQYARTRGHKAKPASTGSVQGQGPAGAPYFSQEQVRHMTRKQVRAHYDEIEKSRRFWR